MLQDMCCRKVHIKRKAEGKKKSFFFFFYLAFVEVVDDFLVELFLQLALCCRLVPVPLGEVGRTHVLRPLRPKQSTRQVRRGCVQCHPWPTVGQNAPRRGPRALHVRRPWSQGHSGLPGPGNEGRTSVQKPTRKERQEGGKAGPRFIQKRNPAVSGNHRTVPLLIAPCNSWGESRAGRFRAVSGEASQGAALHLELLNILVNSREDTQISHTSRTFKLRLKIRLAYPDYNQSPQIINYGVLAA